MLSSPRRRRRGTILFAAGALAVSALCAVPATAAAPRVASATSPTVTSISVPTLNQGESTTATISGTHFVAGATVDLGPGVRCVVQSETATSITTRLSATATAPHGARTLTVTDPGGAKGTLAHALHVDYEAILTKWAVGDGAADWPTSLLRPALTTAPALSLSGSGVTVAHESVSGGQVEVSFSIARGAATGWRTMTITSGASSWVMPHGLKIRPAPTVSSLTSLGQGTTDATVRARGADFEVCASTEPTVSVSGSGVTVDKVSSALGNEMYVTLSVASNAPIGKRNVTVTNCDSGGTATSVGAFSVLGAPAITVVPAIAIGVSRLEVLTGTNLTPTTTLSASGAGVTISHVRFVTASRMSAMITVSPVAALGPRDVTASDTGGASTLDTGVLTVDGLPTLTSATPRGIGANTAVLVTLTGTGLEPGAIVSIARAGSHDRALLESPTKVSGATSLSVIVAATDRTGLASDTISVLNPDGGAAGAVAFQTDPPPILAVASSKTTAGALTISFLHPAGAPIGDTYSARLCADAKMKKACRTMALTKATTSVGGLVPGSLHYVTVTAASSGTFFASTSKVVGAIRATTRLLAPRILRALPSTSAPGQLSVTFVAPKNAGHGQLYTAKACRDAAMTIGCVATGGFASGHQVKGLKPGAGYHVEVRAVATAGYLASSSTPSALVHATVQLLAPKITKVSLVAGVLRVAFTGVKGAPPGQGYTVTACTNAALTVGCYVLTHYHSTKGIAVKPHTSYFVRMTAAASVGYLAASSPILEAHA